MYTAFLRIPQNIRMVMVAIVGALIGLVTYSILYLLIPFQPRATICWTLSFAIGIARQHGLHRAFTFTHPSPYWESLLRAYIMYSASALIGMCVNYILIRVFSVNHIITWLLCLMITASISFLFLRKKVFIEKAG